MLKVFIDGNDDRLRLEDQEGRGIGWVRGQAIGFSGLPSESVALHAVPDAWLALETTLQRAYPGRALRSVNKSNIDLIHDGAYEWVADGFRPLARLIRPHTGRNYSDSFALEFLVPSYATQHVTIAVAHAVWEVLADYISLRTEDEPRPVVSSEPTTFEPAVMAVGGR